MTKTPPRPVDTRGVLSWEDPPPVTTRATSRPRRAWAIVAADLRSRPGVYGLIDEDGSDQTLAARIKNGEHFFTPPGAFHAVTRKRGGVLCTWAVYLGEPDAEP